MTLLHNRIDKKLLKQKLAEETFKRTTVSFYRYVLLTDPQQTRGQLYELWNALNIKGRVYLAKEGINAQMSVPEYNWQTFINQLYALPAFNQVPLKIAVDDDGKSFYKLSVKVREKIVADGLDDNAFDVTNVGKHLSAAEFNAAMESENAIIVDMRNHYESEIGHFEGAITPDADTFREELPMVADLLKDKKDKKLLLYCTGGIRCEKASAYLRHQGFEDVNQLYGGIIQYAREVKEQGLTSKFKGKNFVFDERLGERISEEIISHCHQCEALADTHVNCANPDCHLLFIQCPSCHEKMKGCCSEACMNIISLPIEEQRKLRKGKTKSDAHAVYKSRLRPKLR